MKLWILGLALSFFAMDVPAKPKKGNAEKEMDFDGEVVEGMNKRPLDSLTSLSEGDGDRSKNRLYRRIKNFREENRELAREIVETY